MASEPGPLRSPRRRASPLLKTLRLWDRRANRGGGPSAELVAEWRAQVESERSGGSIEIREMIARLASIDTSDLLTRLRTGAPAAPTTRIEARARVDRLWNDLIDLGPWGRLRRAIEPAMTRLIALQTLVDRAGLPAGPLSPVGTQPNSLARTIGRQSRLGSARSTVGRQLPLGSREWKDGSPISKALLAFLFERERRADGFLQSLRRHARVPLTPGAYPRLDLPLLHTTEIQIDWLAGETDPWERPEIVDRIEMAVAPLRRQGAAVVFVRGESVPSERYDATVAQSAAEFSIPGPAGPISLEPLALLDRAIPMAQRPGFIHVVLAPGAIPPESAVEPTLTPESTSSRSGDRDPIAQSTMPDSRGLARSFHRIGLPARLPDLPLAPGEIVATMAARPPISSKSTVSRSAALAPNARPLTSALPSLASFSPALAWPAPSTEESRAPDEMVATSAAKPLLPSASLLSRSGATAPIARSLTSSWREMSLTPAPLPMRGRGDDVASSLPLPRTGRGMQGDGPGVFDDSLADSVGIDPVEPVASVDDQRELRLPRLPLIFAPPPEADAPPRTSASAFASTIEATHRPRLPTMDVAPPVPAQPPASALSVVAERLLPPKTSLAPIGERATRPPVRIPTDPGTNIADYSEPVRLNLRQEDDSAIGTQSQRSVAESGREFQRELPTIRPTDGSSQTTRQPEVVRVTLDWIAGEDPWQDPLTSESPLRSARDTARDLEQQGVIVQFERGREVVVEHYDQQQARTAAEFIVPTPTGPIVLERFAILDGAMTVTQRPGQLHVLVAPRDVRQTYLRESRVDAPIQYPSLSLVGPDELPGVDQPKGESGPRERRPVRDQAAQASLPELPGRVAVGLPSVAEPVSSATQRTVVTRPPEQAPLIASATRLSEVLSSRVGAPATGETLAAEPLARVALGQPLSPPPALPFDKERAGAGFGPGMDAPSDRSRARPGLVGSTSPSLGQPVLAEPTFPSLGQPVLAASTFTSLGQRGMAASLPQSTAQTGMPELSPLLGGQTTARAEGPGAATPPVDPRSPLSLSKGRAGEGFSPASPPMPTNTASLQLIPLASQAPLVTSIPSATASSYRQELTPSSTPVKVTESLRPAEQSLIFPKSLETTPESTFSDAGQPVELRIGAPPTQTIGDVAIGKFASVPLPSEARNALSTPRADPTRQQGPIEPTGVDQPEEPQIVEVTLDWVTGQDPWRRPEALERAQDAAQPLAERGIALRFVRGHEWPVEQYQTSRSQRSSDFWVAGSAEPIPLEAVEILDRAMLVAIRPGSLQVLVAPDLKLSTGFDRPPEESALSLFRPEPVETSSTVVAPGDASHSLVGPPPGTGLAAGIVPVRVTVDWVVGQDPWSAGRAVEPTPTVAHELARQGIRLEFVRGRALPRESYQLALAQPADAFVVTGPRGPVTLGTVPVFDRAIPVLQRAGEVRLIVAPSPRIALAESDRPPLPLNQPRPLDQESTPQAASTFGRPPDLSRSETLPLRTGVTSTTVSESTSRETERRASTDPEPRRAVIPGARTPSGEPAAARRGPADPIPTRPAASMVSSFATLAETTTAHLGERREFPYFTVAAPLGASVTAPPIGQLVQRSGDADIDAPVIQPLSTFNSASRIGADVGSEADPWGGLSQIGATSAISTSPLSVVVFDVGPSPDDRDPSIARPDPGSVSPSVTYPVSRVGQLGAPNLPLARPRDESPARRESVAGYATTTTFVFVSDTDLADQSPEQFPVARARIDRQAVSGEAAAGPMTSTSHQADSSAEPQAPGGKGADLDALARKVYGEIKWRLALERERSGASRVFRG